MNSKSEIHSILAERGTRYGDFKDHARITQAIKASCADSPNWELLDDDQAEAIEMVAHKLGRILNGDRNYLDSWVDIVGYTQLVVDRLKLEEKQNAEAKTLTSRDDDLDRCRIPDCVCHAVNSVPAFLYRGRDERKSCDNGNLHDSLDSPGLRNTPRVQLAAYDREAVIAIVLYQGFALARPGALVGPMKQSDIPPEIFEKLQRVVFEDGSIWTDSKGFVC